MSIGRERAVSIVEAEGNQLIDGCEANPFALVDACPGWTTTDLAIHTTSVHRRVAHWCTTRATQPSQWPHSAPDDPSTPWAWCREGLRALVVALQNIAPDESVWSWTDQQNGAFYHRRMVHETIIHRWDVQTAGGLAQPIPEDLAVDGIDELAAVGMRFRGNGSSIEYPDDSLAVVASDTGHRWTFAAVDGSLTVERGVATDADGSISGPAQSLLLYLWGRRATDPLMLANPDVASGWAAIAP